MSNTLTPWLAEDWQRLLARREAGRLPHALLIGGARGLGKRLFAEHLRALLLCERPTASGTPCGSCKACHLMRAGNHPDALTITFELRDDGKPRTEITVDQIRALSARFAQTSQRGGWRVAIIEPAEAMNVAAANALLKTLEEPEPNVMMILVSDQWLRLSATIRSRCQRIDVREPEPAQSLAWLIAQGIAAKDAEPALALADGNPGEALVLARPEQRQIVNEVARDLGALAGKAVLIEVVSRWLANDPGLRLRAAVQLVAQAIRRASLGAESDADGLSGLTARADFRKLSAWWDQANRARGQLDTPLRSDLILTEILGGWRDTVAASTNAGA
ncbi:MAG: DNA polymerase III subunit delta' [Ahniella sp.]|nr:DNA polymerase III subunit delta' [Ahniella sp.]